MDSSSLNKGRSGLMFKVEKEPLESPLQCLRIVSTDIEASGASVVEDKWIGSDHRGSA